MIIEEKEIECYAVGERTIGHIRLDKLAKPETVKVTLQGKVIIPDSFSSYGHPNFTEEQERMYAFKKYELERENGEYTPLLAEITYEEAIFNVQRSTFDTIEGIKKSLVNLSSLNELINNRRLFYKAYPNEKLHEFVIFGSFYLDQFGQVLNIEKTKELVVNADVETFDTFIHNNNNSFCTVVPGIYCIPNENLVCPCCGKKITIDDIKNNPCKRINGKIYHEVCWCEYRKNTEIDSLTRCLMDVVYNINDYTYELLPNGYWTLGCQVSYIPWLMIHTIDGDIIIGSRKRVISIEWQENYKPFDLDGLFESENVTKWVENGKRGIHAWSTKDAVEYLLKVLNVVNPDYQS